MQMFQPIMSTVMQTMQMAMQAAFGQSTMSRKTEIQDFDYDKYGCPLSFTQSNGSRAEQQLRSMLQRGPQPPKLLPPAPESPPVLTDADGASDAVSDKSKKRKKKRKRVAEVDSSAADSAAAVEAHAIVPVAEAVTSESKKKKKNKKKGDPDTDAILDKKKGIFADIVAREEEKKKKAKEKAKEERATAAAAKAEAAAKAGAKKPGSKASAKGVQAVGCPTTHTNPNWDPLRLCFGPSRKEA